MCVLCLFPIVVKDDLSEHANLWIQSFPPKSRAVARLFLLKIDVAEKSETKLALLPSSAVVKSSGQTASLCVLALWLARDVRHWAKWLDLSDPYCCPLYSGAAPRPPCRGPLGSLSQTSLPLFSSSVSSYSNLLVLVGLLVTVPSAPAWISLHPLAHRHGSKGEHRT